jgi:hypothetical protein
MKGENKASVKGMSHKHAKVGTVHHEEQCGSHGTPGGHSFRMPKDHEVTDHSKVRSPEHK